MNKLASTYTQVLRYSTEDEEKGFHESLHNDPSDSVGLLSYIDWLMDNGRDAEAEILKRNIKSEREQRGGKVITTQTKPETALAHRDYGNVLTHPEFFVSATDPHDLNVNVRVNLPSKADATKYFWLNGVFSYDEAVPVVKALKAQGYKAAGVDWSHSDKIDKLTKELVEKQ